MTNQDGHDESLAHLLNALTATEPEAGFTQRMVRGIESQQAAATMPSKRHSLPWIIGLWSVPFRTQSLGLKARSIPAWGEAPGTGPAQNQSAVSANHSLPLKFIGLATAMAVAILVIALHSPIHPAKQIASINPPKRLVPTQRIATVNTGNEPALPLVHKPNITATRPTSPTEAELDPSQAKSFPAPPMPLTEQEKLLLRIAHTGDPVELAALNAEKRKRAEAIYEEAYVKAFPPGLSAEAEDALVLKISKGEIQ